MKPGTVLLGPLTAIGRWFGAACSLVGRFARFVGEVAYHMVQPPYYGREFLAAMVSIGYFSLPVVGLTALFTGGALALQVYASGARFNIESVVPTVVAIGMVRELGPVLCGLMVAGRVSSSIAAEIATMKVTEQLDALATLSTHPMKYLVAPRVAAATIVMPMLAGVGDIIGILGGYLVGTARLGFSSAEYVQGSLRYLESEDVASGLTKAAIFGFIVAAVGCYNGINARHGAKGVGLATTNAVTSSSALIIASNFLLTELFFGG